jgi:hypothetical protein
MADQAQLIAQIRFALEQLSERNAQHEWEHLCRHLARERICSNILPATGPVQAGGDQGRDFETFHTFLARSPLGGRSFVGLVSEKPLAFACTLEKERTLPSKVRSDVRTILSSGTPVVGIYMFCSRGMPVAKRHELQEWANTEYTVSLEILDGAAIAELLCDRDLFWLAERYLQLPAELVSMLITGKGDWYRVILDKWRREMHPAQSFADFSEIRTAARAALGPFAYDEEGRPVSRHVRPELPFWIECLDEIAEQGYDIGSLRRRAFYEACVMRLRGLGTLIGQEDRLRRYFSDIPCLEESVDLEDTQVLLTYVGTASRQGLVALEPSEVGLWFEALEQCLDERIDQAVQRDRINEWCALLQVRGHMALCSRLDEGVVNATEALEYWSDLAELVNRTPLFPLESFADTLAEYARFIGTHPDYEQLAQAVDALVAERFGHFKAAEKCLERAKAFREVGDLPRAMAQLHQAKIDWYAEETLGKFLLALGWLGHAYMEQGLFFAAKYYALAAAYTILHAQDLDLKPGIAQALEQAASCDYAMGAWHGFLELAEASAIFYPHFATDPDTDFNDPNGILQHLVFHLALLPAATRLLEMGCESFAHERCMRIAQRLNLADVQEDAQTKAEAVWLGAGSQELWRAIEEQLAGPPWSDAGPVRRAHWKAHGVTWSAQWANNYQTTLAAEEFLAMLQIFLSDLAGYDLCLMRSTLDITLHLAPDEALGTRDYKGFDTRFEPSNTERLAHVMLPPYDQFRDGTLSRHDLQVGVLGIASSLLAEVSLLPTDHFYEVLNERFERGLQNKLLIAAPYGWCLREFVSLQVFNASARLERAPLAQLRPFVCRLPERQPWYDAPGPGYDSEEACKQIRSRYDGFTRPISHTLRRLAREPEFQSTVTQLRADGWKDWHILSAVFHVTINYRLNQRQILLPSPEAETAVTQRLASQPEPEDAPPVPLEQYREERLRQQIPIYMASFARTYGLELHQLTPDFSAIEDFLTHRYSFWTDDIDHDDPFKI